MSMKKIEQLSNKEYLIKLISGVIKDVIKVHGKLDVSSIAKRAAGNLRAKFLELDQIEDTEERYFIKYQSLKEEFKKLLRKEKKYGKKVEHAKNLLKQLGLIKPDTNILTQEDISRQLEIDENTLDQLTTKLAQDLELNTSFNILIEKKRGRSNYWQKTRHDMLL